MTDLPWGGTEALGKQKCAGPKNSLRAGAPLQNQFLACLFGLLRSETPDVNHELPSLGVR